ncbi:uncharacterized protein LOC133122716 isoform X1 [Conger conger]|uniref:uncharacterized protein LOC133122716 isoform X1 n=2 Tax=Conger conger TaxID=82655 RepID=UPI002A59A586|nr:uncharacterized protein LOC133122716 isoform X1 [Conger conger]
MEERRYPMQGFGNPPYVKPSFGFGNPPYVKPSFGQSFKLNDEDNDKNSLYSGGEQRTQPRRMEICPLQTGSENRCYATTSAGQSFKLNDEDNDKNSLYSGGEQRTQPRRMEICPLQTGSENRCYAMTSAGSENRCYATTSAGESLILKDDDDKTSDFPSLKRQLEAELQDFQEVDQCVKKVIRDPLYNTLKCPQALNALDCMLEDGCIFSGSPFLLELPENVRLSVTDLLKKMELDSVDSCDPHNLLKPVGVLVNALSELDDETVTLILDLDDEDRCQVLKLVEGLLEQVCSTDAGVPQWSGQFSENMTMATQLLTSCGLRLAEDSLDPTLGSPGAPNEALLALYIILKGLDMLWGP